MHGSLQWIVLQSVVKCLIMQSFGNCNRRLIRMEGCQFDEHLFSVEMDVVMF